MLEAAAAKGPVYDFTSHRSAAPFTVNQQEYVKNHHMAGYINIATGALVFDKSDPKTPRILLLQRASSDTMPNQWEIPGGACDDEDESILHGVVRELWEEAGLKAKHVDMPVGVPNLFLSRSGKQICKFNFVVHAETDAEGRLEAKLNPEEHQQFVWATEIEVKSKQVKEIELNFTTKELEDTILQAFEQCNER